MTSESSSNNTSVHDASFSSYLTATEENYIHTLINTTRKFHYHHANSKSKTVEDCEIDVFSADKYFSDVIHQENNISTPTYHEQVKKNQTNKAMISPSRLKLQPRTPSVYSESSLNSQSALLRPVLRSSSRRESDNNVRGMKSSFLSCYCCDKKSVDVEDNDEFRNNRGIDRVNKLSLDSTDSFAFPGSERLTSVAKIQTRDEIEEKRRRKKSLEVFGSKRFSLDKNNLNMLSWDAIPSETHDDTESDASSDLFEIECLSCNANPLGLGPIHGSYGSASPTTGYAPSEASVDWSVVTASAADFSVSEDQRSTITSVTRGITGQKSRPTVKMSMNKGGQKPRSVGLLGGCKSQTAVNVAGDVYKSSDKRKSGDSQKMHRFSDSNSSASRLRLESKLPGQGMSQSKRFSGSELLYI